MAFLDQFNKDPSGEEIMNELRAFLGGHNLASGGHSVAPGSHGHLSIEERIYKGMFLLRHLPVSRDAIFDYISTMYDEFVQDYLSQLEGNPLKFSDDKKKLLEETHSAFIIYLEASGEIWAPILSQWTLQLLGQISTQYSSRPAFTRGQSVNEIIHIWMGSKAIQSLLDLTSRCLTCIDHANTDTFISALLDTSANHSPHFDWVVAHVGNSYPQTVVTEVLGLGLQNFSSNPPQVTKLSSVSSVLGYLATTHSKEVQHAFDQMLQNGTTESNTLVEQFAVPYLLQLCSSSVPLLDVLMDSCLPKVKEDTLQKLRVLIPQWVKLHFGGHERTFAALIMHLILKSNRGPTALEILMKGCKTWPLPISLNARNLLDQFTAELSSLLYESDSTRKDLAKNFPCISALKENVDLIIPFLTDSDNQVSKVAMQFIKLLSFYDGPAIGIQAICWFFRISEHDRHLCNLADTIGSLEMKYPEILADSLQILAVKSNLHETTHEFHFQTSETRTTIHQWKNVLRLIDSENVKQYPIRRKITTVLQENLIILTPFLDVRKMNFCIAEASLIVEILSKIKTLTLKVRFGTLLTIERYLVEFMFKVLSVNKEKPDEKIKVINLIAKLLYKLSDDQAVQNDALRSLVQSCLNPECRQLFQDRVVTPKSTRCGFNTGFMNDDDEFQPERFSMYVPLLKENQRRTSSISLSRVHSTSFHSGKLAKNGLKNWNVTPKVEIRENKDASLNLKLFLSVLLNVCMANPGCMPPPFPHMNPMEGEVRVVSVEAMRKVALLLVEIVSPDVMFNGLPWPEEEFSKVQVERDLQIKRAFEDHPYLWALLELVGNYCPSLCYCSVLLRALMATLMAYWTSNQEAKSKTSPTQLEWTVRLVNVMKIGQLIPPPLSYIGQVVHELKANEVVLLLKDIWAYMKVNVPVPTVFIKDSITKRYVRGPEFLKVDSMYTEKLRLTILNNVERLGYLYPKLFPIQESSKDMDK